MKQKQRRRNPGEDKNKQRREEDYEIRAGETTKRITAMLNGQNKNSRCVMVKARHASRSTKLNKEKISCVDKMKKKGH